MFARISHLLPRELSPLLSVHTIKRLSVSSAQSTTSPSPHSESTETVSLALMKKQRRKKKTPTFSTTDQYLYRANAKYTSCTPHYVHRSPASLWLEDVGARQPKTERVLWPPYLSSPETKKRGKPTLVSCYHLMSPVKSIFSLRIFFFINRTIFLSPPPHHLKVEILITRTENTPNAIRTSKAFTFTLARRGRGWLSVCTETRKPSGQRMGARQCIFFVGTLRDNTTIWTTCNYR